MAIDTIPGATPVCKATASAYWAGATALEFIELDAERISETAYAPATSEAFDSQAQSAFYALGQLTERLQGRAKIEGERLSALSRNYKGENA